MTELTLLEQAYEFLNWRNSQPRQDQTPEGIYWETIRLQKMQGSSDAYARWVAANRALDKAERMNLDKDMSSEIEKWENECALAQSDIYAEEDAIIEKDPEYIQDQQIRKLMNGE